MAEPYSIKDGIVKFNGDCETCRDYCGAHCCKAYVINLQADEALSGKYEMEVENFSGNPTYYRFHLKKKNVKWSPYPMCYYLNENYL